MRPKYDTAAAIAANQHGVVSRSQLLQAGLTPEAIKRRMRAGRLHTIHRGVYAVGHRVLTLEGRWMAAVLACGPNAALSHTTAAAAWDLRRAGTTIHVTVPGRGGRQAPRGVRLHRSPTLTPAEIASYRGIPVTKPARTIIDLARTVTDTELERIVHEADKRGLVDFRDLETARSASLQAVLRAYDPAPTRSQLERTFLKLCRDHGIKRPEVNVLIDGYDYHRSPK